MPGTNRSIYQTARKTTPYTQEQAAEQLNTSVESIKAWELAQRVPGNDIVRKMMDVYEAPWLGLAHIQATCGALGVLPPGDIRIQSLAPASLALMNRDADLSHNFHRLMQIAEDNVVDASEQLDFETIRQRIWDVIAACFQVLFSPGIMGAKKEPPRAGTRSGSVQGLSTENDYKIIISQPVENASPVLRGGRCDLP